MNAIAKACLSATSYFLPNDTKNLDVQTGILDATAMTCSAFNGVLSPSSYFTPTLCPISPTCPSPTAEKWVRPLGYAERFMTTAHDNACMTTVYALWLDSRTPVQFNVIKQTTVLMYRKMPHLRMCLGRHEDDLWWREMQGDFVDVEQLITDDVMGTFESMLKKRYKMEEGPLWFVRYLTERAEKQLPVHDNNHNLKYKQVIVFGFHHNVSDGTTNMKFCKLFLSVLNDLLQEREVDNLQEGYFATPLHDSLAVKASSQWWLWRLFLKRFYTGILTYGAFVRNFTHHYPMPTQTEAATRVLHHELDEVTTQSLLKRCKMEGVTMNSAFTAAANLGLYRLILKENTTMETTQFNSTHAINMRRYWPKEARVDSCGCHISMLDVNFVTAKKDFTSFWEYVRRLHATISHHLTETHLALKVQPMSERLKMVIFFNSFLAWAGFPSSNDNHYCVTNMGDLTTAFPGTGPEVEVARMIRAVSGQFMPTLCQHTLQTFRGRFCYSLDYYTQKMTPETAREYSQAIVDILCSTIHQPN